MIRVLKVSCGIACLAVFAACAAVAQQSSSSQRGTSTAAASPSSADTKFMKEAAEGGMAEVALGQLAMEKASNSEVKKFGQRMVDDHTQANNELKRLASEKNVDLPQDLNAKDKTTKASLEKLSGEQFDHAYMKDMVTDHKKDVSDFKRESTSAQDPAVKDFATQTLPKLQQHLKLAESIAPKVPVQSSSR
jgi:putative membrane protein